MAANVNAPIYQLNKIHRFAGVISNIIGIRTLDNARFFMFTVEKAEMNYLIMLKKYSSRFILKFHQNQVVHVFNAEALRCNFVHVSIYMSPVCFKIKNKYDVMLTDIYMSVGDDPRPTEIKMIENEQDDKDENENEDDDSN